MNPVLSNFRENKGLGSEDRSSCVFQDINIPAYHKMVSSSKDENEISYKML
jgi:hypothetical protein